MSRSKKIFNSFWEKPEYNVWMYHCLVLISVKGLALEDVIKSIESKISDYSYAKQCCLNPLFAEEFIFVGTCAFAVVRK